MFTVKQKPAFVAGYYLLHLFIYVSNICTFKIVVLMNMMAYNSFKILVDYGEFNEVMFVSMTCHQVIHCTTIVLHTFLQQAIRLHTSLERCEHWFHSGLQETNFNIKQCNIRGCNDWHEQKECYSRGNMIKIRIAA